MHRGILTSLTLGLMTIWSAPAMAGELWLTIDQVRNYDLETPVSSIVVGNPAIADVTVQSNNKILLYGKTPGLTNIYFFDQNGDRIDNLNIRVQSPSGNMLVLNRGIERATYTCTQKCELTAAVGDSDAIFGQVTGQATAKVSTALEAAASSFTGN
ncbi:MAG: pilus assembly protein N-terminal domain-containing protein [Aquisalinus sp.]|nr:pilus assembly protein N-terminal domain-containing protein [Aquisalinus sp.]